MTSVNWQKELQQALKLPEPELRAQQQVIQTTGTIAIGSVAGDIYEIGKSLVGTILLANDFRVYDLGVDMPVEIFMAKVKETETGATLPDLSTLLTTTTTLQRQVVEALEEASLCDQV